MVIFFDILILGGYHMELNLIGELKIMKENEIKPNFSSLQRKYNIDRHTIKKYYNNNGVPQRKQRKNNEALL